MYTGGGRKGERRGEREREREREEEGRERERGIRHCEGREKSLYNTSPPIFAGSNTPGYTPFLVWYRPVSMEALHHNNPWTHTHT